MSSRYYIYQMTAVTEDGTKGAYIGQHKIGKRSPLEDGYKGSGSDWKKYILSQNIPVEKVILRMCDNIEEANYWEKYYIESAKAQGIYLWNKYKGGGGHEYNKIYTEEELKEHRKQYREINKEHIAEHKKQYYEANKEYYKQYREANREHIAEYNKQYSKQYYEENKAQIAEYYKQYREANKEHIAEYKKEYYEENKEQHTERMKQYREANKEHIAEYKKQWYEANREKIKEHKKQYHQQYNNQPCLYNSETLTLNALRNRFRKAGITNPTAEAKKYLII